ncbi:MAG: hypothetical protein RMK20_16130 [Verrucomicrobiales bacterium]|nr:hypothetical protein [Verrucomicrobiales bacterium]
MNSANFALLEQAVRRFNEAFGYFILAERLNIELLLAMGELARLRGRGDLADALWSAWQQTRQPQFIAKSDTA